MSEILRDIFEGKKNEGAHDEFIKFSKGSFGNKYLINAKKQKSQWAIKTGAEFANYLVRSCLQGVSGEIKITGVIVATFDMKSKADFPIEKVKKFMGIQQAVISTDIAPEKILSLMDAYPRAFYALSFVTPECQLKIKAKAPKGAKPAAGGGKTPVADFCSLKTARDDIIKTLFFECPDFKEIALNHTLQITNIEIPKGVSDPVQMREQSKRQGKIIRKLTADGYEKSSEAEFLA